MEQRGIATGLWKVVDETVHRSEAELRTRTVSRFEPARTLARKSSDLPICEMNISHVLDLSVVTIHVVI